MSAGVLDPWLPAAVNVWDWPIPREAFAQIDIGQVGIDFITVRRFSNEISGRNQGPRRFKAWRQHESWGRL